MFQFRVMSQNRELSDSSFPNSFHIGTFVSFLRFLSYYKRSKSVWFAFNWAKVLKVYFYQRTVNLKTLYLTI